MATLTISCPMLDMKLPDGTDIPPVKATKLEFSDPELCSKLLRELQLELVNSVAVQLRASLAKLALLDPAFRVLTSAGLYVTADLDRLAPAPPEACRVQGPAPSARAYCASCHHEIQGPPMIKLSCHKCASSKIIHPH